MPKKVDTSGYDYRISLARVPLIRLPKNINTEEDLKAALFDIYVIEDYMDDYEQFVEIYNHLFTIFVNCYPIGNLRNYMIRFKLYHDEKKEYGLPFKKFILTMPIFGSLQLLWKTIRVTDQFIMYDYDSATLQNMANDVNYLLTQYEVDEKIRSAIITDTYYRYTQLAVTLADVLNVTLSLEDYVIPYLKYPEMAELTDVPISTELQPTEVKAEIQRRSKLLKEIYTRSNINGIGIIIASKTKFNERQFQEMNISHGQIPDVYGTLIMKIIENNGLNRGLATPGDFYLASTVSRYAAIINNDDMGEVGYFFRNVSIMCGTVTLSKTIHDCKTNHYLKYTVDDLRFIEGKYYKESLSDHDLKIVRRGDTHLIGKTIYLRSAIYCACGDEICHVCYGETYKHIYDLPGMGIYNSQVITNPIYQNILSVKHAIDGEIMTVEMNEEFAKMFTLVESFVETNADIDSSEYLLLVESNLLEEMDYRSENFGLVSEPYIYVTDGKTISRCELYNIQDITYNTRILHALKLSKKHAGYHQCPLSILEDDGVISITLLNYGVSDVLKDFKRLIKYDSSDHTVNEYLDEIISIVRKAKIKAGLAQIEVLINRLVRDPNDLTRRPDYNNDICDEAIVGVTKVIMNTKGAPVRLAFEQTKRQLLSYDHYDLAGDAYVQPLFEEFRQTKWREQKELQEERTKKS